MLCPVPKRRHTNPVAAPVFNLSYDDGPTQWTEPILDVLKLHDARATFFVLGSYVAGNEHVLQRSHVVGSCSTIARRVDGSEWRACAAGRLTGRPGLELSGCTDFGRRGAVEVWHCPAPLASAPIVQ